MENLRSILRILLFNERLSNTFPVCAITIIVIRIEKLRSRNFFILQNTKKEMMEERCWTLCKNLTSTMSCLIMTHKRALVNKFIWAKAPRNFPSIDPWPKGQGYEKLIVHLYLAIESCFP